MGGKIISIVNFKGGVGKTTLAVNISACLAQEHKEKRVAIVDLDPQSNSSVWLLGPSQWASFNRREGFVKTARAMFTGTVSKEFFVKPFNDPKSEEYLPNLFLLPACFHMISLEKAILQSCNKRRLDGRYREGDELLFLSDDVKVLHEWFDYVFIDLPPNLYLGTCNAICHSDYVLIPCVPDTLSTSGLKLMIHELEKTFTPMLQNARIQKTSRVLGVALTRFKPGTNEHQNGVAKIEQIMLQFANGEHLMVDKKTKVFKDQPVREYMVHSEAVQENLPICYYSKKSGACLDIRNLAHAILEALEERE